MATRASLARDRGQQQFQGRVRKWKREWQAVGGSGTAGESSAKLMLLKWVATEERSEEFVGTRYPHLVPVQAANGKPHQAPAQPAVPPADFQASHAVTAPEGVAAEQSMDVDAPAAAATMDVDMPDAPQQRQQPGEDAPAQQEAGTAVGAQGAESHPGDALGSLPAAPTSTAAPSAAALPASQGVSADSGSASFPGFPPRIPSVPTPTVLAAAGAAAAFGDAVAALAASASASQPGQPASEAGQNPAGLFSGLTADLGGPNTQAAAVQISQASKQKVTDFSGETTAMPAQEEPLSAGVTRAMAGENTEAPDSMGDWSTAPAHHPDAKTNAAGAAAGPLASAAAVVAPPGHPAPITQPPSSLQTIQVAQAAVEREPFQAQPLTDSSGSAFHEATEPPTASASGGFAQLRQPSLAAEAQTMTAVSSAAGLQDLVLSATVAEEVAVAQEPDIDAKPTGELPSTSAGSG